MKRTGLFELNAVVAVATHKSFRAAAAELGLSPSALSHSVAALEQQLGVRLFHRTTRSVSLSEAGSHFLARVRPALGVIDAAMESINEFRDTPTGTLRINASEGAARMILMTKVLAFVKRHPDVRVELVTQDQLVDIVAEGYDVGVRSADLVPKDMIAVKFGSDVSFAVVGSPRYFRTRGRPAVPGDLAKHACIRRRWPSGAIYRWEFEKRGKEVIVDVKGPLTLDRDDLMLRAAREGAGLAYLGEWTVADDLAAGRLVRVLEDWTPSYPGLRLYYPGHRHVPATLRAFLDLVRETDGTYRS